jgi:crossover junction endodeoxyribonuclease RusA
VSVKRTRQARAFVEPEPVEGTSSIALPWPPSVNTYWRHDRGRTHVSTTGRTYRLIVERMVMERNLRRFGRARVAVSIVAYPPDKRARDLDNLLKALLDALGAWTEKRSGNVVRAFGGVYRSDSQIDDLHITRAHVVRGGAVWVSIREIGAPAKG